MSERFGDWTLDAVIAVGGLGEVWCATRDAQVVALKRLHSHLARNADVRRQFATEQQLATQLPHHPHLVHALEAGEIAGRPYLALALAPGDDLRRWLAPPLAPGHGRATAESLAGSGTLAASLAGSGTAGGPLAGSGTPGGPAAEPRPLTGAQRRAIVIAACEAAGHLHHHGFVHGDINPGNLVVAPGGGTVLVDLGIARPIGEAGAVRGTHAYMAPEQVRGEAWTPATDVFALGVVLWELVAGARLFHRGPPWLSMAAVVEATVPALDDPALDAIAQAALAKDPARRLATPAALAARLRGR